MKKILCVLTLLLFPLLGFSQKNTACTTTTLRYTGRQEIVTPSEVESYTNTYFNYKTTGSPSGVSLTIEAGNFPASELTPDTKIAAVTNTTGADMGSVAGAFQNWYVNVGTFTGGTSPTIVLKSCFSRSTFSISRFATSPTFSSLSAGQAVVTNASKTLVSQRIFTVDTSTAGADCIAKINTADAAAGAGPAIIVVTGSCAPLASTTAPVILAQHTILFEEGGPYTFSGSASFVLPRSVRIACDSPVTLQWTSATGTFITFGSGASGTDVSWEPGGIFGCNVKGNLGGSDTSIGVQLGNSTADAHGILIQNSTISGFGNNVVFSGTGDAFGIRIDNSNIHSAACNGILFDLTAGVAPETETISNSFVFSNGLASATCAGLQVAASKNADVRITNTHFDNNGNGTLGQIHASATASLTMFAENNHFEPVAVSASAVACLSSTPAICSIYLSGNEFTPTAAAIALQPPVVKVGQGKLRMVGNDVTSKGGTATMSPAIDAGASVGAQQMEVLLTGNNFHCNSNPTKCEVVAITVTSGFANYYFVGNMMTNYDTTPTIFTVGAADVGCHDFGTQVNIGAPIGALTCTGAGIFTGNIKYVAADFTTANNANLQNITGLSWTIPANTALTVPFHCALAYSQATAAVAVAFGIQDVTVSPTSLLAMGQMFTNTTAVTEANVTITNTTATAIVSATPSAITTIWNATLDGLIEAPANASSSAINIMVSTANGADAVTVKRGGFCRIF